MSSNIIRGSWDPCQSILKLEQHICCIPSTADSSIKSPSYTRRIYFLKTIKWDTHDRFLSCIIPILNKWDSASHENFFLHKDYIWTTQWCWLSPKSWCSFQHKTEKMHQQQEAVVQNHSIFFTFGYQHNHSTLNSVYFRLWLFVTSFLHKDFITYSRDILSLEHSLSFPSIILRNDNDVQRDFSAFIPR